MCHPPRSTSARRINLVEATLGGLFAAIAICVAGTASLGIASAAITITTTPIAGVLTDFTGLGDQSLPYLDANGRTVSASGLGTFISSNGLYYITSGTGDLTFSGLAAGTTQIGFTDTPPFTSATLTMSLSNGWSGYVADFRTTGYSRSPVPEPASLGLLAIALSLFGVAAARLKKRGWVNSAE